MFNPNLHSNRAPLGLAIGLVLGTFTPSANAALGAGASLSITDGVGACLLGGTYPDSCLYGVTNVTSGSYFGMDLDANGNFDPGNLTPVIAAGSGSIPIGSTISASGSHNGPLDGSESPAFDTWDFNGAVGMDYLTKAITVITDNGGDADVIDMTGWSITWNGIPLITMGGDTANFSSDTGLGTISCYPDSSKANTTPCVDGVYYELDFVTHVPVGDISGFGGTFYTFHAVGTVSVSNTAPVAADQSISTTPNTATSWTPSVSDADGDTLTCSIVTDAPGSEGTADVSSNCSSGTFTPATGFSGTTSFTYKANDGTSDSNTVTVTVTVSTTPPPVANGDSATTNAGTAVDIDVTANDTDADGTVDKTTVSATNGSHGTTSVNTTTGVVTYTPASGFAGTDTFTYTVKDNDGQTSGSATVTVTVLATAPATETGTFAPGGTASSVGSSTGGGLTVADVGTDSALSQQCVGGCFDFTVSGLSNGASVQVVLPLSADIPADAVYRKLVSGSWQDFDVSGSDSIASAAATSTSPSVVCPVPGSSSYVVGLTAGDRCVQLTLTDGGANDSDGLANGTVVDPGGIGVKGTVTQAAIPSGSSGCTLGNGRNPVGLEWLALLGGLVGLGLWRKRQG